jgi:hypothetical protein
MTGENRESNVSTNFSYQVRPNLVNDRLLIELLRISRQMFQQSHTCAAIRAGIQLHKRRDNDGRVLGIRYTLPKPEE